VEDLLRAFEAAYGNRERAAGQIYNIGGGQENTVSLLELMDHIADLTGARADYDWADARAGDQLIYVSNHDKFSQQTGWQPQVNLDGILKGIHRWYRNNRELFAPTRAELLTSAILTQARRTA
jgi:CDP-paratose 2-epimerase